MAFWFFKKQDDPDSRVNLTFDAHSDDADKNMQALRFAMNVADVFVSMGMPAQDVVVAVLKILRRYCERRVYVDITSGVITMSQDRGLSLAPITLTRVVEDRRVNTILMQAILRLIQDIKLENLTIDEAEERFKGFIRGKSPYPNWIQIVAGGGISAGVSMIFTESWIVIVIAFLSGCLAEYVMRLMYRRAIPAFFVRIAAAAIMTVIAAGVTWMSENTTTIFTTATNPTLIVVGGIVMMLMGVAFVAAIQDMIDEYYITGLARLAKVIFMTLSVVIGIIFGLTIARTLGATMAVSPDPIPVGSYGMQLLAAAILAFSAAASSQSGLVSLIWSTIVGVSAWSLSVLISYAEFSSVIAAGFGGALAGVAAEVLSRRFRIPAVSLLTAGVIPLVPGLALFNGLMLVTGSTPGTSYFDQGLATLISATSIAVAIGAGTSLGTIIGRPLRKQLGFIRAAMPRQVNRLRRKNDNGTLPADTS